jgi:hypothetical protein
VTPKRASRHGRFRTSPVVQALAVILAAVVFGIPAGQNGSPVRGVFVAGLILVVGGSVIALGHRRASGHTSASGEWLRSQPLILRIILFSVGVAFFWAVLAGLKSGSWQVAVLVGIFNFALWFAIVGWANRPSRTG